jgi:putative peptidoglycan lipid II flippase
VRRGHFEVERALISRLVRLLIAAGIMAAALYAILPYAAPYLTAASGIFEQVGAILVLIAIAMIVYFGSAFAIGGASLGMIRRNMKRGAGAPAATPAAEE